MRYCYVLLILAFATSAFAQEAIADFIGPFGPFGPPGLVVPPTPQPGDNGNQLIAMPFLGFGYSQFERAMNKIRVVASERNGIINSDQNPALLHQPLAYHAVQIEHTPWQTGIDFNPNSHALKASLQKQFRQGGASWGLRYENTSLSPILKDHQGFFSEIPSKGQVIRLAFAKPISTHWTLGLAAKYANRQPNLNGSFSELNTTNAIAADIGFSYRNSKTVSDWQKLNWQWGLSLSNLGPKVKSEIPSDVKYPLPTALNIGLLVEEEFLLRNRAALRISGAYQFNKLLIPSACIPCDDDQNNIQDYFEYSAIGGIFRSFVDAPGGFRNELKEISHQFDMSVLYEFNPHFGLNANATLFYQHRDYGGLQYLATQMGIRLHNIHFNVTYWRPNGSVFPIAQRSLGISLGYQRFITAS